ncbi:MAG: hypothetical protein RIR95_1448, partial [Pseudomonadota bacterium]
SEATGQGKGAVYKAAMKPEFLGLKSR